ncbi:MAG: helix-turn-helix transcriptional regulator [Acidimicrobiales bacterium]
MPTLDRLERLTDLVLVLLGTSRPLTLGEIAREVPGYPEAHDARRQAFERDKRVLRQEGVPVLTEAVEGPDQYGYRIDPDAFYLPDLRLEPDEQAALHLAVAGVHLGDPSGRDALLKLGASGVVEPAPLALLAPPAALVVLFDAVRSHAEVRFDYRGATRRVAPGGVRFRRGRWYLTGWDLDRSGGRSFRVDRFDGPPASGEPGSGLLPEGFDAGAVAPEEPVRPGSGDEADVVVLVDPVEAPRVVEEVGPQAVAERRPDGSVVLRLEVTLPEALRSWVLGLLDHAEVLGPPAARRAMVEWLSATASVPSEPEVAVTLPAGDGPPPDGPPADGPPADGPPARGAGGRPVPSAGDASHRLRRLLAIVGWLARVGEAPLAEVADRFGLSQDEVVHELERAACCGIPPYSPDALLEIVVTDTTVEAFLPEAMARPRRLTPGEGFALAAAARTILAVPGADRDGALARALAKLEVALGDRQALVVDLDEPSRLPEVRRAVERGTPVEIEYHSASTDETSTRVVEPLGLVSLDGHWYLDAHCRRAGGLRRFRVDRIRGWRELAATGERPAGRPAEPYVPSSEAFVPGPGATMASLRLEPAAAWVLESVPVQAVEPLGGGRHDVTVAVGGRAWLERLLLALGPDARVLGPPELTDVGAAAARRVLARYG